jgi:hypothetical protein
LFVTRTRVLGITALAALIYNLVTGGHPVATLIMVTAGAGCLLLLLLHGAFRLADMRGGKIIYFGLFAAGFWAVLSGFNFDLNILLAALAVTGVFWTLGRWVAGPPRDPNCRCIEYKGIVSSGNCPVHRSR